MLPGLILHAFETGDARRLADHLSGMPDRVFTTLDCHDGIPIRPDLDGILSPSRDARHRHACRAARRERQPHPLADPRRRARRPPAQLHLLLGARRPTTTGTSRRAPSSCSPGACRRCTTSGCWPGTNDRLAVEQTGEGRAINRHDYTLAEIDEALDRPVVQRQLDLIRLRNSHPAFDGTLEVKRRWQEPTPSLRGGPLRRSAQWT